MLAPASQRSTPVSEDEIQERFLAVLPQIEAYAGFCFRGRPRHHREELVAEVVAYGWRWFRRLLETGKDPTRFTSTFTRYAVLAIRNGRSVGRSVNGRELYSAARSGELCVHSLESRCPNELCSWKEILVEKRAFPPDEVAGMRVDFGDWLESLPERSRRLADLLARGEQASMVARTLHISRARVSQLRAELAASWQQFQGELEPAEGLQAVLA